MDDAQFFNKGIDLLRNPEELKKVNFKVAEDGSIELAIMKSYGFPVKLKVIGAKASKELFYQKVTFPMLATVQDLRKSQQELCELLLRKDKEIKEYKDEGGRIALRHLKTPKFDDKNHLSKHNQFDAHFGFVEIPGFLAEQAREVAVKEEIPEKLKAPPVKEELLSQAEIKEEVSASQSSQAIRKRPRKLHNL